MEIRTYRITPTLWLGDEPMCGATATSDVDIALGLIRIREKVVLPHGAWDTAREILTRLGMDEATIADRLHFARTGQVLAAL